MEETINLEKNQPGLPKRSKYLERLTSHENRYHTKHLFAEPIKINTSFTGGGYKENRLKKLSAILNPQSENQQEDALSIETLFKENWSNWANYIIEVKPSPPTKKITERYKTSLQQHQDWLSEGDTEDDSQETRDRYNNFYAGINSALYAQWLRSMPLWMK